MRERVRKILASHPFAEGQFRRLAWSRLNFAEIEMRLLHDLPGRPFSVAIDVGAAVGGYSWILARKSQRVIAFEPGEGHARLLRAGAIGSRVTVEELGLADRCGVAVLHTPGADVQSHYCATLSTANPISTNSTKRPIRVSTLDSYLAAALKPGERVDMLKVDVEGFENEVFTGAALTLSQHRPTIICEIEARHNSRYAEVFEMLEALGYRAFVYDGTFRPITARELPKFQTEVALRYRLSSGYRTSQNRYLNNFVFEHPLSRIPITKTGTAGR